MKKDKLYTTIGTVIIKCNFPYATGATKLFNFECELWEYEYNMDNIINNIELQFTEKNPDVYLITKVNFQSLTTVTRKM